jgi:hypothetical protein
MSGSESAAPDNARPRLVRVLNVDTDRSRPRRQASDDDRAPRKGGRSVSTPATRAIRQGGEADTEALKVEDQKAMLDASLTRTSLAENR